MAFPKTYTPEEKPQGNSRYTMTKFKEFPKMKLRILSDFVEGKSVWGEKDGKRYPYRVRPEEAMQVSWIGINKFSGQPERIHKFLAAVCFNYTTKQVEVFECDKGVVLEALYALDTNEDWGDLKDYDITISKTGAGTETRYSIVPSNKIPFVDAVTKDLAKQVSLEALFVGGNPFDTVDHKEQVTQDDSIIPENEDVSDQVTEAMPF